MKGTVRRGMTLAGDRLLRAALADSEKTPAENAMIVDMMRNDIGRIARRGSVRVTSAFDVEQYPTVFQMTSTVPKPRPRSPRSCGGSFRRFDYGSAKIRPCRSSANWNRKPGASIPAASATCARQEARFNVAIRTVSIDRTAGQAEYGVGGGIVWDSATALEYAECRVKAALLTTE